ncbi:MAG: phosphate/phosphite/phosphonate ABC transporter substrate-binding protein [Campylobacterota bacterium]
MKVFKIVFVISLFFNILFAQNLKIGVIPYTDTLKILTIHQPLKEFLSSRLNGEVEIYTSSSYENFFEDTKNGEFDIVITGPHFGLLHINDGFIPIVRYDTELRPIFVVSKDSKYSKIGDLKNTKVSLSNYLSVSSIGGIKALIDQGFKNDLDFTLVNAKSHTSAIMSVVLGDNDVAITTYTPVKQLTDDNIKRKIRILESDFAMPHLFTIANSSLPSEIVQKIKIVLLDFQSSPKGIEFFQKTGYRGYRDISQKDLDDIMPVLEDTKKFLGVK